MQGAVQDCRQGCAVRLAVLRFVFPFGPSRPFLYHITLFGTCSFAAVTFLDHEVRAKCRALARNMLARFLPAGRGAGKKLRTCSNNARTCSRNHFWRYFRAPATEFDQCWPTSPKLWPTLSEFCGRRSETTLAVLPVSLFEHVTSIFPASFPQPVRRRGTRERCSSSFSQRPARAAGAFFQLVLHKFQRVEVPGGCVTFGETPGWIVHLKIARPILSRR